MEKVLYTMKPDKNTMKDTSIKVNVRCQEYGFATVKGNIKLV